MKTQTKQQMVIEFPNHLQLHELGADGTVAVRTIKKSELTFPIESKPEANQTTQSV